MAKFGKGPLQRGEQRALGAALEYFCDEGPAGLEDLGRNRERGLGERDNSQMVGRGMAGRRRRHVAQNNIGEAPERLSDRRRDGRVVNIGAQNCGAGDRRGLGDVEPHDEAAPGAGANALDGDLRPAARRTAEIDDAPAGQQQAETGIELDQLESGARAVAEPARFGDIGVVQLTRQPFG